MQLRTCVRVFWSVLVHKLVNRAQGDLLMISRIVRSLLPMTSIMGIHAADYNSSHERVFFFLCARAHPH